jgi:hypothetical protein
MTRKELTRMMPTNGDDLSSATRIVELGYPTVGPVLPDMVRWMRVAESTVADRFAQFLAELGDPAVEAICEGLQRENCWLRHRVFVQVLPRWQPETIKRLANVLAIVATQPDAYDNDLRSISILTKHQLVESEWLRSWVSFKRERLTERLDLIQQVEEELKHVAF